MGVVQVLAAPRYGNKNNGFARQTQGNSIARALTQSTAASSAPQQLFQPLASIGNAGKIVEDTGTLIPTPSAPATKQKQPDAPLAAPPAAPPATTPGAGGVAAPDLASDPIYQQVLALTTKNVQDAESGALATKKQSLIDYGYDPTLDSTGASKSLFPDEDTLLAAEHNPFSTVAQLHHGYDRNLNSIADALNQKNLFYSSARANAEADAGRDFQGALAGAAGQRDQLLGQIASALASARQGADAQRIGVANDVWDRLTKNPATVAPPTVPPPSDDPTDPNTDPNGDGTGSRTEPNAPVFLDANDPNVDRVAAALARAFRGTRNVGY
jgi:hypothetical protein